ncbi:hypothetical protein PsYK624_116030 [Phanerochaete sordida]|uniref:Uncharacterized protein n=1 Tax=Phanerochaete sordida TaxID=48140 RepID=A0A9P3GL09_9APHY|nr:hypothetical protein PsYK624_116030 [Phanerochaete sordida]
MLTMTKDGNRANGWLGKRKMLPGIAGFSFIRSTAERCMVLMSRRSTCMTQRPLYNPTLPARMLAGHPTTASRGPTTRCTALSRLRPCKTAGSDLTCTSRPSGLCSSYMGMSTGLARPCSDATIPNLIKKRKPQPRENKLLAEYTSCPRYVNSSRPRARCWCTACGT